MTCNVLQQGMHECWSRMSALTFGLCGSQILSNAWCPMLKNIELTPLTAVTASCIETSCCFDVVSGYIISAHGARLRFDRSLSKGVASTSLILSRLHHAGWEGTCP